ncbi:hypothetical protein [Amycolatopsis taiwanensis]|uniref:hypothetical protein n=1 Tax=Amycolatopsis taiwanensis TaxID=342230 RepID=UPI0004815B54|nr:hypothetical protein [Amycolatopsis taiwanensis]
MPTADAHIPTDRASRYLGQVCQHVKQMSRMPHLLQGGKLAVEHVDWSDTSGTIRFARGGTYGAPAAPSNTGA